jgi:hypothetical protein
MTPKPKPKNYSKILDVLNTPQAAKTFSPKTYIDLVGQYSRKAFDNGEISKKEYMSIVKPLFGDAGIMASDKIKKYKDELNKYANGGRIGFLDGGDTKYNAMVTEMYIKLGGEEGTGMDIDSFAKEYFKKFNQGGRVGLRYGGDTMGGINDKSISSPGPDRSKVSAQQERNNQAAVREAQAFNQKKEETINRIKEAQTSRGGGLANFIKNNIAPEYRLYTRTMVPGLKTGRLDEEYFPDDFKLDLRKQALDKYARTGELSGMVNEVDQHMSRGEINKLTKFPSTYAALGTYSYQIDPKTLDVKITDKYDWNPAYGTQGNFTGFVGNQPEKGGRDVDASMLKDYVVNSLKKGIDFPSGLELLGNLLGPRSSKGEGVDIDINIPTEFAAMRADTSYATGGRIRYSEGSPDIEELRKRVEELMDDGETFGDAVKIAVKELENG